MQHVKLNLKDMIFCLLWGIYEHSVSGIVSCRYPTNVGSCIHGNDMQYL